MCSTITMHTDSGMSMTHAKNTFNDLIFIKSTFQSYDKSEHMSLIVTCKISTVAN